MDIHNALVTLRPKSSFVQRGPDYSGLEWADGNSEAKPTESEIQAEITRLQAAYDTQAYARSRQAEYPPLADQLDHIYHNGIASWKANMVKPVKDKYPKPS